MEQPLYRFLTKNNILRNPSVFQSIAEQFDISVKTVAAHKANAQRKLNIGSRKEIISYAILQGWMREN